MTLRLDHLGRLRTFARLLCADLRVAQSVGDGDRVAQDLEAILGLAHHAGETPLVINALVSVAIAMVGSRELGWTVTQYPGLLNDAQLTRLEMKLAGFGGSGAIQLPIEGIRADYLDQLQRTYTDDGQGDGRFCMEGLRFVAASAGQQVGAAEFLWGPLAGANMPRRKDLADTWNHLIDLLRKEDAMPVGQCVQSEFDREVSRLTGDPVLADKYRLQLILVPAIPKCRNAMLEGTLERDGTVVGLALERWRLRHGAYPSDLTELVPEVLLAVPIDPFDGSPLKYKVMDGQAVVYSVGSDGKDDGGQFAATQRENVQHGQWVSRAERGSQAPGDLRLFPLVREPRPADEPANGNDPS
jgi:hypothetical protein